MHCLYIKFSYINNPGLFYLYIDHYNTDVVNGNNESPLDKAMGNLFWREGCVDVGLYLINNGCGNNSTRAKLLCGACKRGRLDVVKELVEQHHIIPSGKHSTRYCLIVVQQCTETVPVYTGHA